MKGDKYLSYAILLQSLLAIIQLVLPMYGIASVERTATLRVLATVIIFLPGILVVLRRNSKSLFLPFVLYFMLLLVHYLIFPASHTFIESSKSITLTPINILTGILAYNMRSLEEFKRTFLIVSRLSVPVAVIFIWGHLNSPNFIEEKGYDMSFGYTLLLPTLFLFTQNNAVDKVMSLLIWTLIVFCASRGPAVVVVVFYVISVLFYSRKRKIKIWQVAIFVALIGVGFALLPKYLDYESSRTVMLFESNEVFSHDSDRNVLYARALNYIWESPVVGNGIGSDWYYLGGYCHNIYLELSLHYGIIVSTLFCLFFLCLCFVIYRNKSVVSITENKQLLLLIIIAGIMPLLVSSSYLLNANFGLTLGYLLRYKMNRKIIAE